MSSHQHFDILIIGAGLSGVGAGCMLKRHCPQKSFAILEGMESFGGTWLLHKYPGTRTDSDLYTFGYHFKPWSGKPIASRQEILDYIGEAIDENNLAPHIHYNHQIVSADWSSADKCWTVLAEHNGETVKFCANFIWACQGYYRHDKGYTPDWAGLGDFSGQVIHPQHWDESVDLTDKKVVVIGSGATAATLIPNLAGKCKMVTMLQRTPTYFSPAKNADTLAEQLHALDVDEQWIHEILRKKMVKERTEVLQKSALYPEVMTDYFINLIKPHLPEGFDIDTHFRPPYRPFEQRVAFVPDGDLFTAIRTGTAQVVTDNIAHFDKTGIVLASGNRLDADIVITATGFNLVFVGGVPYSIDGQVIDFKDKISLRGSMIAGVPNLAMVFGYTMHSWTLRLEVIGHFVCNLLNYMDKNGHTVVTPTLREEDKDMAILPFLSLSSGYVARGVQNFPKQGDKPEWTYSQDYLSEKESVAKTDFGDKVFDYQ